MMTANLFNSNNLEGIISEINENFKDCYVHPVKKVAKKTKDFLFNPKAYGWAALYAPIFGSWAYYQNRDKEFLVKAGSALIRGSASFIFGRQLLRFAQIIAKKIKNPVLAYSTGIVTPFVAWTIIVYGGMSLLGAENLTPLIVADAITTPPSMFLPIYFERNNIEVHPFRNAINFIRKKRGKHSDYQKL